LLLGFRLKVAMLAIDSRFVSLAAIAVILSACNGERRAFSCGIEASVA